MLYRDPATVAQIPNRRTPFLPFIMGEPIGVIGAGITGLATAYVLSSKYKVTVVARDLPGDLGRSWASPWSVASPLAQTVPPTTDFVQKSNSSSRAGAVFHPQANSSKLQQEMQATCFKFYWSIAHRDPTSGVQVYAVTEYRDDQVDESFFWYKTLMPDYRLLASSELPQGVTIGAQYTSLAINPLVLLPWLKRQLEARGVKFIRAEVRSVDEARSLTKAKLIVNASGVGAKRLAGDEAVRPIRGQTMFVKTDFAQVVMRGGSEYTYVIPRMGSGGVVMGGVKSDRLDAEVDVELKSDILMRVNRITNDAFKDVDLASVTDIVAFRPGREGGLRVEREGNVVHAYGMVGAGYTYSFGAAERVRQLVEGDGTKARL